MVIFKVCLEVAATKLTPGLNLVWGVGGWGCKKWSVGLEQLDGRDRE